MKNFAKQLRGPEHVDRLASHQKSVNAFQLTKFTKARPKTLPRSIRALLRSFVKWPCEVAWGPMGLGLVNAAPSRKAPGAYAGSIHHFKAVLRCGVK